MKVLCCRNVRKECHNDLVGAIWVYRVLTGSNGVKHGSKVGHEGRPSHVLWVKWVTWAVWATGLVKLSKMTIGATGICGQVFWASSLLKGCLGL